MSGMMKKRNRIIVIIVGHEILDQLLIRLEHECKSYENCKVKEIKSYAYKRAAKNYRS